MAGATFATADAALKEFYLEPTREELNNDNLLLAQVEKNTKDVEGRRAVLSLHVTRNSGVGARASGDNLPTAGAQGYAEERVGLKRNYGRIQIEGPLLRAMKSDRGSFERALDSEVKGVVADLKRDVNRQLFGDGSGKIATCAVTTADTVVLLNASTSLSAINQLEVGMVVDIGATGTPTSVASGRTITAINETTPSITISGAAVTTAVTDFVFRSGAGNDGTQRELTGLAAIVASSGTLFNIDPTAYPVWKSHVDTSGGTVTENKLGKAQDRVFRKSGQDVNLWISTDGVCRAYSAQLTSTKRFNDTLDLKGGFSALSVSVGRKAVALTWDRDTPDGTAYGLSTGNIYEHQMSDWEFMEEDGALLSRVAGQDAYEATLFKYHELTTDKRHAHAKLTGLTEA